MCACMCVRVSGYKYKSLCAGVRGVEFTCACVRVCVRVCARAREVKRVTAGMCV